MKVSLVGFDIHVCVSLLCPFRSTCLRLQTASSPCRSWINVNVWHNYSSSDLLRIPLNYFRRKEQKHHIPFKGTQRISSSPECLHKNTKVAQQAQRSRHFLRSIFLSRVASLNCPFGWVHQLNFNWWLLRFLNSDKAQFFNMTTAKMNHFKCNLHCISLSTHRFKHF